ncbi:MAG: NIPSNAP family protein [Betaproteobacteria bacterium]|nr:NIPSNAP family protein [Betaproteobacteria bacterium]
MIYVTETFALTSRALAQVEERLERELPRRTALSQLGACWRTEVGTLNQLILVWPYRDEAERRRVEADQAARAGWPPDIGSLLVERQATLWRPAPFSPPFVPRRLGNLYEIRVYTYPAGGIPGVIEAWNEIIDERVRHSPLVAAWYTDEGPEHEWMHIWAYANAAERERVRDTVSRLGIWPISVVDRRLNRTPRAVSIRMHNMLVVPVRFSPLC